MVDEYRRRWGGEEWQVFAYALAQLRYGPSNVQRVPDSVHGDGGLEFFTTDGCLVQCYAPEEVSDVKKSTSAIKQKATRDLPKLISNSSIISGMLQNIKARRWILMCPFFDDKSVISHVREKGRDIVAAGLPFIANDFEALVHSQEDFAVEVDKLRQTSLGMQIAVQVDETKVVSEARSDFAKKLPDKLRRAYPKHDSAQIDAATEEHVRSYFRSANTLEQLRQYHPAIWERLQITVTSEERRLLLVGATGDAPIDQLIASLDRIEAGLRQDLPTLSQAARTDLANGTLSDWLIRCPLDFR